MPFLETGPLQTWGALGRASQVAWPAPGLTFDVGPLGQPAWGGPAAGPLLSFTGRACPARLLILIPQTLNFLNALQFIPFQSIQTDLEILRACFQITTIKGFPGGSDGKESA